MMTQFRSDVIAAVENERELWDSTSDGYRLNHVKAQCWDRVHKKLKGMGHTKSLEEVKTTWKKLEGYVEKKYRASHWIGSRAAMDSHGNVRISNLAAEPAEGVEQGSSVSTEDYEPSDLSEPASPAVTVVAPSQLKHLRSRSTSASSTPPATTSRRVLGEGRKRPHEEVAESSSSYIRETMGAIRTRLEKEAADVGNKFAVFGHFVGTFLGDLPEEVAVLKMKVISDVLFLPVDANFEIQIMPVEQASENV